MQAATKYISQWPKGWKRINFYFVVNLQKEKRVESCTSLYDTCGQTDRWRRILLSSQFKFWRSFGGAGDIKDIGDMWPSFVVDGILFPSSASQRAGQETPMIESWEYSCVCGKVLLIPHPHVIHICTWGSGSRKKAGNCILYVPVSKCIPKHLSVQWTVPSMYGRSLTGALSVGIYESTNFTYRRIPASSSCLHGDIKIWAYSFYKIEYSIDKQRFGDYVIDVCHKPQPQQLGLSAGYQQQQ
jgi:hypothetical protein